jgi:Ca2+-binding RTX toxin-like protein
MSSSIASLRAPSAPARPPWSPRASRPPVANRYRPVFDTLEDRLAPTGGVTIELVDPTVSLCEGVAVELRANVIGTVGTPLVQWHVNGQIVEGATGSSFTFTAGDDGSYVIAVSVLDGLVLLSADIVLDIDNAPPVAGVNGPGSGVAGQPLTFTLTASDSDGDQDAGFTFHIDWDGDGIVDQTTPASPGNGAGLEVTHAFTTTGDFQVGVTATDKDGGVSDPATLDVTISTFAMADNVLYIGGTTGNDRIRIASKGKPRPVDANLKLVHNGARQIMRGVSRVVVHAQAGNDFVKVVGAVRVRAVIFGGDGNDRLKGAKAADVIVGGLGNDHIHGGTGRDILIGGAGADRLIGGRANDILIGGTLRYENDTKALNALRAVWRGGGSFAARVAALRDTTQEPFLNSTTVSDDGARDRLIGAAALDWYFANQPSDKIVGLKRREPVN